MATGGNNARARERGGEKQGLYPPKSFSRRTIGRGCHTATHKKSPYKATTCAPALPNRVATRLPLSAEMAFHFDWLRVAEQMPPTQNRGACSVFTKHEQKTLPAGSGLMHLGCIALGRLRGGEGVGGEEGRARNAHARIYAHASPCARRAMRASPPVPSCPHQGALRAPVARPASDPQPDPQPSGVRKNA